MAPPGGSAPPGEGVCSPQGTGSGSPWGKESGPQGKGSGPPGDRTRPSPPSYRPLPMRTGGPLASQSTESGVPYVGPTHTHDISCVPPKTCVRARHQNACTARGNPVVRPSMRGTAQRARYGPARQAWPSAAGTTHSTRYGPARQAWPITPSTTLHAKHDRQGPARQAQPIPPGTTLHGPQARPCTAGTTQHATSSRKSPVLPSRDHTRSCRSNTTMPPRQANATTTP